jgi:hypothetical protein
MRYVLLLLPLAACWRLEIADDAPPPHQIHGDPDASVRPDAANVCGSCTSDELCVEFFDGTCGFAGVRCAPKLVPGCEPSLAACSPECEEAYCKADNDIFGCMYRGGSCNPDPHAFTCYGP